jgi:16S rRNA (cytidine1402-2'-O)-methyltransferase
MPKPHDVSFAADGIAPVRSSKRPEGLYFVATPIGNLRDITLRALDVLGTVDLIACEDTRHTGKLLTAYGIKTRLLSYHDHNAARVRPGLLDRLGRGESVALVSDAGTPLISDPGYRLLTEAVAAGIPVTTLPGASSVLAALTLAGLPTDRFLYLGFAPNRSAARRRFLEPFATVAATMVLLESPKRLAKCLEDLSVVLGDREAAITRELTKLHEEVVRDRLSVLADKFANEPAPRGEVVLVIGPPDADAGEALDEDQIDALLKAGLKTGKPSAVAAKVASETGLPRRQLYQRAIGLKQDLTGDEDG